jgi:hypothetical protein
MAMSDDSWSSPEGDSTALLTVPADVLSEPVCPDTPPPDHDAAGAVAVFNLNSTAEMPGDIYQALKDYQQSVSGKLRFLHQVLPVLNKRFFDNALPLQTFSCEPERSSRLGSYQLKDGMALLNHININTRQLPRSPTDLLAAMTHLLVHCELHLPCSPSTGRYHNAQIRQRLAAIGVPCTKDGKAQDMTEPFLGFLREIELILESIPFKEEEDEEEQETERGRPPSRMQLWFCGCTKVYASDWGTGRVEIEATCNKFGCGNSFRLIERG